MVDPTLVQRFIRPINNPDDAEFWARVRIATSSEHQLNVAVTQDVADYMAFRETIRENMIRKFMYTDNTIAAMQEKNKAHLIPHMQANHTVATTVFNEIKQQLLGHQAVCEFPLDISRMKEIREFIGGLPSSCRIVFVTQKRYGKKGQSAIVNSIRSVSQQNGRNLLVFACQFNKQKAAMSHELYLNSSVGIVFQLRLFHNGLMQEFDYDPGVFALFLDGTDRPVFSMSRRMDGTYPSSINPQAVWEVKEYYDNKTYGSRVNDSIYETILSGGECKMVEQFLGRERVQHFLLVDGYYGLGVLGRALLLRYIDCFFQEVVDDIIVGIDVRDAWPAVADRIILNQEPNRGYSLFFGM